jgi:hypothetical protein
MVAGTTASPSAGARNCAGLKSGRSHSYCLFCGCWGSLPATSKTSRKRLPRISPFEVLTQVIDDYMDAQC